MLGVLIVVSFFAGVCSYVVGYAFTASRESPLRTLAGGVALAGCVIFALFVPPLVAYVTGLGSAESVSASGDSTYRWFWIGFIVVGLLAGLRVWRMRLFSPGAGMFRLDESPVSRAESELPLADSLQDALDVLAREKVAQRDVPHLAPAIKRVGTRFFHELPEKKSEVYAMVASCIPPAVAADVTGLLLQGASREG
ncbi:MAG: hypothetical protein JXA36_00595 [Coriobacteriia bacterium]|nr:hypothetical protein [Coriobacteriia bacterium]